MSTETIQRPDLSSQSNTDREYIVTAFNNDTNSFDEVIYILVLATECSLDEAEMETWEIHHMGSSCVHIASKEECEHAARIIGSIGVRAEVQKNL